MNRRRRLLAAIAAIALAPALACAGASGGVLWRVERRRVAPCWLFGTLHLPDTRLLPPPLAVERALAASRSYLMELYPDEAVAARFFEAGHLPDGERLDALLDAARYRELERRLIEAGIAPGVACRLKPWAALLALTGRRAGEGETTLDNALYIRARMARLRVEELDSVEEQIAVFDDLPAATQLALLAACIDEYERLHAIAEATIAAYLAGDLARLAAAGRAFEARVPQLAAHHVVLEKKFIHDRSVVMAYRMQASLRRGGAFVAVGALHLHGSRGIPALLAEEYGWRVRAVRMA